MITDPHFRIKDRVARNRHLAEYIAAHPDCLEIALSNLDRWQAWGRTHPAPIHEWRTLIHAAQQSPEGLEHLIHFLNTADPDVEPLLSCSPLVGLEPSTSATAP